MGIDKDKKQATEAAELRRQAEERLRAKTELRPPRTGEETQRLVHELEVHQIELEMQNAELRQARNEAEKALENYSDLYDFAPVGYFILDRDEVILAANLTGASLLGIERARLIGRRFGPFVTGEARSAFTAFLGKVFANRDKEACEVAIKRDGKRPLHLQIEAVASASAEECRIAVIDISARSEAQTQARESERRYASLFNNRHVAMLLIDPETGEILNANPAACSFYGYNSEQFAALRICDINTLPQQDILKKLDQALNKDTSLFHFRHRLANGEIRDVEVYSGPIEIKEQKLLYSIVHDVSERKRIEDKLRKSERQLAEAQRLAHFGSWEWDSIADEISGSDEFNRIFGLILSSYESFMEVVHTDDRETVNKAVQETLAHQAPYNVHYRIIRPDGITRIIHAQGVAETDCAGKTVRMIGTAQDVTERRQRETEIERLASFPRLNPNPIWELDCEGKVTFCNMAAELIMQKIKCSDNINPFIPEDLSEIFQTLQEKKNIPYVREIEINGLFFMEHIHLVQQFDVIRIYGIDITERKRAEAALEILHAKLATHAVELESANIELEAFNCMVAHDLRNPLNTISGYSQVVQQLCGNILDVDCKKYIREIYEATERMDRLIDTLLKFSRTIRVEMRHVTVDLSGMAQEVAASLERTEPERRVTFRIAEGIKVNGDTDLLYIVLDNLIGNAWKYSSNREGTVIEFGVKEIEGKPVCFVRDNGPGFDMADAEKLFLPFKRLPGTAEFSGHGIGLATVERIIRRHGGRVWAEGEPGKGATFYFPC
jgi:PAS domain S-box-containing protein